MFWVLNVNVNGGLQKYGPTDTVVVATVMMMGTVVDVVVEDRCDGVGEMNRRWVAIGVFTTAASLYDAATGILYTDARSSISGHGTRHNRCKL